jgi:hypothetical protein
LRFPGHYQNVARRISCCVINRHAVISPEQSLQKLLRLRGVTYQRNDQQTGIERPTGTHLGFIAQDIQEVFPEKVQMDAQGFLQTAYSDYDPLVVESIRALNNKVEAQQAENTSLRSENEDLKKRLEALEAKMGKVMEMLERK